MAYSGWDNTNYNILADASNTATKSITFTAVAGQYIPFRVQYGNAGSTYAFSVAITAPDGTVLVSGTVQASNYIVQFSCDGVTAPPFPSLYQTCTNQGYEVAYQSFTGVYSASGATDVNPAYFKTITPKVTDVGEAGIYRTTVAAGCTTFSFYGSTLSCNYYYMTYRGYIYATQVGVYSITFPSGIDDRGWIWMGPNAYSGYNGTNYIVEGSYSGLVVTSSLTASFTATQVGQYIPWRIAFAQKTYGVTFTAVITAPDGTVLVSGSNTKTIGNNNMVRYSCDGTTAPKFAAFGAET